MMSPKKQIIDLSQVSKKDGRSKDQINANQALEEIQRSSQRQLKQMRKDYRVGEQKQMRDIDLSDEALLNLIQYLGMHYVVRFQGISRMWYCRI